MPLAPMNIIYPTRVAKEMYARCNTFAWLVSRLGLNRRTPYVEGGRMDALENTLMFFLETRPGSECTPSLCIIPPKARVYTPDSHTKASA